MNPGLPTASGRQVVRALERAGFIVERVAGSQHILVDPGDPRRAVTVPVHGGRDLKPGTLQPGTLRAIIRQAGMTIEEFRDLL